MRSLTFGVLVALASRSALTHANVMALSPAADTTLNAFTTSLNNNMGGHDRVLSGTANNFSRRRGLFQFDVAGSIPALATIHDATLTLSVPDGSTDAESTFDLFRVLVNWGEGRGTGSLGEAALSGEATWDYRIFDTVEWASPGAAAGTDYDATPSASTFVQGVDTYNWTGLVSDVQFWLDNPSIDFGWILISQVEDVPGTSRRFGAANAGDDAPVLTIDFTMVPEPEVWVILIPGGVLLRRRWQNM